MSNTELEFVIFCVENIAKRLDTPGEDIYQLLAVKSDILTDYIIPYYDSLHTQSKDYIVDDIIDLMRREGVL